MVGPLASIAEGTWMLRSGTNDQVGFDSVIGKIGNNKPNNYEMTTSTSEIAVRQCGHQFTMAIPR